MKLFYAPRTRSTRPRWMLEELGVPYELVNVDLKKREQKNPDYLKINPMGAVPAFQDGGTSFSESGAIVSYLADKFPEKKLAPALNTPERGSYYQWMFFAMSSLDSQIVGIFYHTTLLPEGERIPAYVEYCKKGLVKPTSVLTDHLKSNEFILGKAFSAADIMIASNLAFAKSLKLIDDQPGLLDYVERMTSRPAFLRAIA